MDITYFQASVSVRVKENLTQNQFGKAIGQLINVVFSNSEEWTRFHESRERKGYTFSTLTNEKIANGYFKADKGDVCQFYIFSGNQDFMNLLENCLFESDQLKVLDIIIDHKTWKGAVPTIQVKNPLLLKDDSSGQREIYFLRPTDSKEKKEEFLRYLNQFIKADFEYITGERLPENFTYILDIKQPKIGHYEENGIKLIGTKGHFLVDTSILGKLITQHLMTHGMGIKSSYLGAGSIILKGD
ncbi:hypothetical protein [Vagococcus humatus]|uniref:Uncharacterized protein n=1 Tax=Vagococcus humatus TaxID=1889241 RepID=A0A429Z9C0_9ENTE|nr:hypothetical protein [Vagococcus humatus]RST90278.1 hypothetical protein C7P63_04170 [Vagococcus humatus]